MRGNCTYLSLRDVVACLRLLVQIKACIPEKMVETVLVEVAHFEPAAVQVVADGVYASVLCSLPRVKDDMYKSAHEAAKEK
jgi:hydrocephalus-inducing protein